MRKLFRHGMLLLSIALSGDIIACSCKGEATVEGNLQEADVVFKGTVLSVVFSNNYDSLGIKYHGDTTKKDEVFKFPMAIYRIKVEKIYKGDVISDTLTIITPKYGPACGFRYYIGQKYITYATKQDLLLSRSKLQRFSDDRKTFWTHRCTRTFNYSELEETEILTILKK